MEDAPEVGGEDALLHAGEIGAGAERRRCARQHDDPCVATRRLCVEQTEQGRVVDGVAAFGTVERDDHHARCDVVAAFHPYHGRHCMTAPDRHDDSTRPDPAGDPIRARRVQIAKWTLLANRIGYLVLALAMTLFVLAFLFGFTAPMATAIVVTLVVSFVLLAPSIVLGYAVKAADRADAEQDW